LIKLVTIFTKRVITYQKITIMYASCTKHIGEPRVENPLLYTFPVNLTRLFRSLTLWSPRRLEQGFPKYDLQTAGVYNCCYAGLHSINNSKALNIHPVLETFNNKSTLLQVWTSY
jgi:hypothetical protein